MSGATWLTTEHQWEKSSNGNRWRYTAKRYLTWPTGNPSGSGQDVVLATVTRNTDTRQATFNKWFAVVHPKAEDRAMFSTKEEAMAWATAIVHLNQ